MQMQVGYKLIEIASGKVNQEWGGTWGQCPGVPNPINLPDGSQVCGMQEGDECNGYRLSAWMMEPPPPAIPQQVPMWAVRTVLQNDGLFDQADALVKASTDNALKNVWEYGIFADRNSNAIATLSAALGLTSEQVDQMFIDANNLSV